MYHKLKRNQYKTKTCACGYTGKFFGKKCGVCRTKARKKTTARKRKATGELELFKQIWEERPHVSEVSGRALGPFNVSFFSHILNKGHYPEARLDKENILLKSTDEHRLWEFERYNLVHLKEWEHVFELRNKLKEKYANR